jgi:hypothetical protein
MKEVGNNSVGVGFAGLLIGGLLTWVAIGNTEPSEPSTSEAHIAELALAVQELGAQVRLLSEVEIDSPSVQNEPVTRISEPASISPEILVRLDSLDATLAKLLESYAGIVNSQLSSHVAPPPLEDIHRPVDTVALEGLGLNEEIDNDLQHLNWSYQEVLNVYGKPSRSNPSPGGVGHKWYYELPNGGDVIFWFVDGQVARAMSMD